MTTSIPEYISEKDIQARVAELGKEITKRFQGKELLLVGVLKGSVIFLSDLARSIDLPLELEFLGASSYGTGTTSSGDVKLTLDISRPIEGRHVIVVEDIVDTGLTIHYLMDVLKLRNPASLSLCSLLRKKARVEIEAKIDFLGFDIEDKFVVGYGLDAAHKYRNLKYIGYLDTLLQAHDEEKNK